MDAAAVTGPPADSSRDGWNRWISSPRPHLLAGVVLLNFALSLIVGLVVLRDFPNSADEYAYEISARIFAEGKLSVASPEPPRFFDFTHCVNDGRFYGKYPPGWPLLLSVGCIFGAPWLINPLVGALTLIGLHALGRRLFSVPVANLALLASVGNPFFVFNSASYFSHSACLLFITLFLVCFVRFRREPQSMGAALGMSAAAGAAFVTRPYTAILVFAPLLAMLGWSLVRRGEGLRLLKALPALAGPSLVLAVLFLAYNALQTGSPFVMPFAQYAPTDRPDLSDTFRDLGSRFRDHVFLRLVHLGFWLPLSPLFVVAFAFGRPEERRRGLPLLLLAAGLMVGYFFYWGSGINQYGPRYLYEAFTALALLGASVMHRFGKGAMVMLLGVLLLNGVVLGRAWSHHSKDVAGRMDVYDRVRDQKLQNAIVFMSSGSGSMPVGDLTRNGIHFNEPVLYVWDRREENLKLLERYPGRQGFYYSFDPATRSGLLLPFREAPVRGRPR